MSDHERIWLEPVGAPDRTWCSDNVYEGDGVEYIRAELVEQREKDARRVALEDAAKVTETYKRKIWRYWDDPDEIPELKRIPFQDDIAMAIRALQPDKG